MTVGLFLTDRTCRAIAAETLKIVSANVHDLWKGRPINGSGCVISRQAMPKSSLCLASGMLCLVAALSGCQGRFDPASLKLKKDAPAKLTIPSHVKGTVSEFAVMVGGGDVPVHAHGVLVGLGDDGSAEVPAHLNYSIVDYLLKENLGSYRRGTADWTPERLLRSKDTSVVFVGGAVPLGAPVGTEFDVYVSSLPETGTQSIDGGMLWPIDLSLAYRGISRPNVDTKTWGRAQGSVFVNPFVEPGASGKPAKALEGKIIGGGKVTRSQPVRLQLHRPDFQVADLIQRTICTRFDPDRKPLQSDIVKGRSRSVVEITVPAQYAGDYRHFLQLIMHLPIRYGQGGWEGYARGVADRMEKPVANRHELALVLEAMGRGVIPILQNLYASESAEAAFYAARTGMRLGDPMASETVLGFASSSESAQQLPAIKELGSHRQVLRAGPVLRKLINDPNERIRMAAYESLLKRGDRAVITTTNISGRFHLDVVASRGNYTIYATQAIEPRIALFGSDIRVNTPVYFEAPDGLVTINGFGDSETLTVFRSVPLAGRISSPIEVVPTVRSLVEALGKTPDPDKHGKVSSLGLTYGQVVGTLYRICKAGDISAKFVLQQTQALQRIYEGAATVDRPDMPRK